MDIKTKDGIDIYILPDCAKCTYEGKHPEDMEKCPLYNFDDEGDICVPECCNYYTEEWTPGENQMIKNCENCHSYRKRKCFTSDGVCYLVPSKPKFVKKTDSCKYHKPKEGD